MKHFTRTVMYGLGKLITATIPPFEEPEFELRPLSRPPKVLLAGQEQFVDFELKALTPIPPSKLQWQLPSNTTLTLLEGDMPGLTNKLSQLMPVNSRCRLRLTLKTARNSGVFGAFCLRCYGREKQHRWDNVYLGARFHYTVKG